MNKKISIILIAGVIIIAGAIYFSQQPKGTQNNQLNQPANNGINTSPKISTVTINNFSFSPAGLNINKGDTVTWINQDQVSHRISGAGFQSDTLSKGQSYSFTFAVAGTFDYICSIHPSMKGIITVR